MRSLDVEVHDVEGVLLDELAARLHRVAHQDGEDLVSADRILHAHPEQGARLRIHGGLPELLGVHLAQALVALQGDPILGGAHDHLDQLVEALRGDFLAVGVDHRARTFVEGRDLRVALEELRVVRRLEQIGAKHGRLGARDMDLGGVAVLPAHQPGAPAFQLARHLAYRRGHLAVTHTALGGLELPPQEPIEDGPRHAAPGEFGEDRAELEHTLERLQQRLFLDGLRLAGDLDRGLLHPLREEELLHLALAHEIPLRLALLHLEERGLGDEEPPRLDDRHHVTEEEREEQGADVGAVHVGVRHEDHLVIAQLGDVELLRPDPRAEGGDEEPDLLVREHLVVARFLGVDDLASEREHRLRLPIPPLLGGAAGGITLHEEDLAELRIALRAIGELGRQPFVVAPTLARELPRLPRCLARLGGPHALVGDLAGGGRVLLEGLRQAIVDDLLDEPLHLGVAELRLGLPFELWIRDAHRDYRGQALADVVTGDPSLEGLEKALGLRVAGDLAGEGRPESREVGATFARVDVVGKGEHVFLVAVVVLQGDFDLDIVLLALEEEHLGMDGRLVLVQVLDELDDPALVEEGVGALVALVLDDDFQSLVEEGELAQPIRESIEGEGRLLEDLRVRLEANDRAVLRAFFSLGERTGGHPVLVALSPHVAAAADLQLQPLAQRVHHRDADSVESAGHLVRGMLELAAGVQHGEDDLGRGLARLLMGVDGNASPVVAHRTGAVRMQDDLDAVAEAAHGLVHGVVDNLVDKVVEPIGPRVADVHGRPLAHGLETLEDLDVACGIGLCAHATTPTRAPVASATMPPLTSQHVPPLLSATPGSAVVRKTWPCLWMCRSTRCCTSGSSSDRASSSNSTGGLPTALSTGPASARRRVRTRSRCWPRDPKLRMSRPSSSTTRSSRWGPTSVSFRRRSSCRRRSRASRNAASVTSMGRAERYSSRTWWSEPAISG